MLTVIYYRYIAYVDMYLPSATRRADSNVQHLAEHIAKQLHSKHSDGTVTGFLRGFLKCEDLKINSGWLDPKPEAD